MANALADNLGESALILAGSRISFMNVFVKKRTLSLPLDEYMYIYLN